ncbi:hypothetical protein MIR68_005085 [Amoeboaphelidium protococcarum]|nr:hypothetical protein MIR68_005085 [Amoeboaphelidium protococcarum]
MSEYRLLVDLELDASLKSKIEDMCAQLNGYYRLEQDSDDGPTTIVIGHDLSGTATIMYNDLINHVISDSSLNMEHLVKLRHDERNDLIHNRKAREKWLAQQNDAISHRLDPILRRKVEHSLSVIADAFRQYGFDNLSISYNGGKDCTVLLRLLQIGCAIHFTNVENATPIECREPYYGPGVINALYIRSQYPFEEIEKFVHQASLSYGLRLFEYDGSIKSGLQAFLQQWSEYCQSSSPSSRAIFMGTRRTDPHCQHLQAFSPTDSNNGWPLVMRVNPILDWSFTEIWQFIDVLNVPYCNLYDRGYTSIGGKNDTIPNALLADPESPCGFEPARLMPSDVADQEERSGRLK